MDAYRKVEHPVPYLFSIDRENHFLYYFGANHSQDPANIQFGMLRTFWNDFLIKTHKENSIVLIEGGKRPLAPSGEQAIHHGAEPEYMTYLASVEGIEVFSPEPPESMRFAKFIEKFTKEEIAYYGFARMTYQWNGFHKDQPDFNVYIQDSLNNDRENSGWSDFDFSLDNMINVHEKMFHRKFDKTDKQFFYDVINPTTTFSRINELSRFEDSGLRDTYILKEIEEYWNAGKNLFIVYGSSHAVMHEPALRKLI